MFKKKMTKFHGNKIIFFVFVLLFVSTILSPYKLVNAAGDLSTNSVIDNNKNISVKINISNIDGLSSISNGSELLPIYNITKEVYLNNVSHFESTIWNNLNQTFQTMHSLSISANSIELEDLTKSIILNFTIVDAVTETKIIVTPSTRIFNPITFLYEIVDRATIQSVNNTYNVNMNWINIELPGTITAPINLINGSINYTLSFSDVVDLSSLKENELTSWNLTQNVFSSSSTNNSKSVDVSLELPATARNIRVQNHIIIYHLPSFVNFPFLQILGVLGSILIIIGLILYTSSGEKEVQSQQQFDTKWKERYKKKKK
ncbi:MAG: hypothetical protein ACTSUV_04735 [Candidatus Ranarchaeia archaeon]